MFAGNGYKNFPVGFCKRGCLPLLLVLFLTACQPASNQSAAEPEGIGAGIIQFDATVVPIPTVGAYSGIYTIDDSRSDRYNYIARSEAILAFEATVIAGRTLAMDRQFYRWDSLVNSNGNLNPYIIKTSEAGRIPVISLYTLNNNDTEVACPGNAKKIWRCIADGHMNDHLNDIAQKIRDSGIAQLMFSLVHEPENEIRCNIKRSTDPQHECKPVGKSYDMGSAADYTDAWRHLVALFDASGVMNTDFIWILQAATFDDDIRRSREFPEVNTMYPGDDVIDWVGADSYNTAFDNNWRSLATLTTPFVEWAAENTALKPLALAEFGSAEDPEKLDVLKRAEWFTEANSWLKETPGIKAVMYFNRTEDFGSPESFRDWRVDTLFGANQTPAAFYNDALSESLAAFSRWMNDPYLLHSDSVVD